jgi:CrcB protein
MRAVVYEAAMVILGGATGALLRYATTGLVYRAYGGSFPLGTLSVNALGSFFIGLLWSLSRWSSISSEWRVFLFIGLLGSFTTFSTFSLETFTMLQDREILQATLNIAVNLILCLILVWVGFMLGESITARAAGRW